MAKTLAAWKHFSSWIISPLNVASVANEVRARSPGDVSVPRNGLGAITSSLQAAPALCFLSHNRFNLSLHRPLPLLFSPIFPEGELSGPLPRGPGCGTSRGACCLSLHHNTQKRFKRTPILITPFLHYLIRLRSSSSFSSFLLFFFSLSPFLNFFLNFCVFLILFQNAASPLCLRWHCFNTS